MENPPKTDSSHGNHLVNIHLEFTDEIDVKYRWTGVPVGAFVSSHIHNIKHTMRTYPWNLWSVEGLKVEHNPLKLCFGFGLMWFHICESIFLCAHCLFCLFRLSWTHHRRPLLPICRVSKESIWDVTNLRCTLISTINILQGRSALQPKVDIHREMEMRVTACITGSAPLVCAPEAHNRF